MSSVKTPVSHIAFDERGRAILAGTTIKVIEIALDQIANGWSPAEIHYQHYQSMSMGQIHAALSYYYDHQPEFDAEIEQQLREVERLRTETGESPFRRKMREEGGLP
jgi:uncharacterized protein (DUF433 family)